MISKDHKRKLRWAGIDDGSSPEEADASVAVPSVASPAVSSSQCSSAHVPLSEFVPQSTVSAHDENPWADMVSEACGVAGVAEDSRVREFLPPGYRREDTEVCFLMDSFYYMIKSKKSKGA